MPRNQKRKKNKGKRKNVLLKLNDVDQQIGRSCCSQMDFVEYDEAPEFLRDNRFITGGYRCQLDFWDSFRSIFFIHNETMNIWTHLLGNIIFLAYLITGLITISSFEESPYKKLMFVAATISCIITYLLSSIYHTFKCHSSKTYIILLRADCASIIFTIAIVTGVSCHFGFFCYPVLQNTYLIISLIFGVLLFFVIIFSSNFSTWHYFLFVAFASFGFIPLFHWTFLFGPFSVVVKLFFWRIMGMYIFLGCGFIVWNFRIPERWFIGKFNIWCSSHQLWHIFVMLGPGLLLVTAIDFMKFAKDNPCTV